MSDKYLLKYHPLTTALGDSFREEEENESSNLRSSNSGQTGKSSNTNSTTFHHQNAPETESGGVNPCPAAGTNKSRIAGLLFNLNNKEAELQGKCLSNKADFQSFISSKKSELETLNNDVTFASAIDPVTGECDTETMKSIESDVKSIEITINNEFKKLEDLGCCNATSLTSDQTIELETLLNDRQNAFYSEWRELILGVEIGTESNEDKGNPLGLIDLEQNDLIEFLDNEVVFGDYVSKTIHDFIIEGACAKSFEEILVSFQRELSLYEFDRHAEIVSLALERRMFYSQGLENWNEIFDTINSPSADLAYTLTGVAIGAAISAASGPFSIVFGVAWALIAYRADLNDEFIAERFEQLEDLKSILNDLPQDLEAFNSIFDQSLPDFQSQLAQIDRIENRENRQQALGEFVPLFIQGIIEAMARYAMLTRGEEINNVLAILDGSGAPPQSFATESLPLSHIPVAHESVDCIGEQCGVGSRLRYRVRVIQPGRSMNNYHYAPEMLESSAALLEGVPVQAYGYGQYQPMFSHLPQDVEPVQPSGFALNRVGILTDAAYESHDQFGEGLFATLIVDKAAEGWARSILDEATTPGGNGTGVSIFADIDGDYEYDAVHDELFVRVDAIKHFRSVDLASSPAAGGAIVSALEDACVNERTRIASLLWWIKNLPAEEIMAARNWRTW